MPLALIDPAPGMSPQEFAERLTHALLSGETLGSLRGMTEKDLEAIYSVARQLYAQARYRDARKLFELLMKLNHLEGRYFMAYAACLQMLKQYEPALLYYTMATAFDLSDPKPTFHSCECLIALGRVPEACEGLDIVIEQSDQPAHANLRQRAQALRALIEQQAAATEGSDA